MRLNTAIGLLLTQATNIAPATSSAENTGDASLLLKKKRKMTRRGLLQATAERIMKDAENVRPVLDNLDTFQRDPFIQDIALGQAPGQDGSSDLRLQKTVKKRRSLSRTEKKIECDPSSQELDIGILSCGIGKYCDESTESSLGGLCVDHENEASSSVNRMLQDDALTPYCSGGDLYMSYNCNCQAVDNITGTGEVFCTPYEDCCSVVDGENSTVCRTLTYNITFAERAVEAFETCYDITQPYARSACVTTYYSNSTDATCAWMIDDDICSSCTPSGINRSACQEFDCTNIPGDFAVASNASCSGSEPALFLPLPILDELQLVTNVCEDIATPAPSISTVPTTSASPSISNAPSPAPSEEGPPRAFFASCNKNSQCISQNCKGQVCRTSSTSKANKIKLSRGRGGAGGGGVKGGTNRRQLRRRQTGPRGA